MKILHIIKGLGRGGAERLLAETIALHNTAHRFDIVYFLPWKDQLVKDLQQLGCNVYLLSAKSTAAMPLQIPELVRLIRRNGYDILHCHLPWAGIIGRIAARLSGRPIVYTEHNNVFTYHPLTRALHRIKLSWLHHIITVSADTQAALKKMGTNGVPVTTIVNGVNIEKFSRSSAQVSGIRNSLRLPPGTTVVATAAVFRPQKRLDRWLHIAARVREKKANVHFLILGDGPEREKLRAIAASHNLDSVVTFAGLVEDPTPYLAGADIYLMSSDYEGLPVALLEAMSMDCAPVVTAVGGIPAVIRHRENGILYDTEDTNAAADAIVELANSESLRKSLATRARMTVDESFNLRDMVRKLESVYISVIEENKR